MPENFLIKYIYIIAIFIIGTVAAIGPFILVYLVAPRTREKKTTATYECGADLFGTAWVRFGISYYIYALIFLAFGVDVLYLFPVITVFGELDGIMVALEVVLFVGILSLAVIYAWVKGAFLWERKIKIGR